MRLRIFNFFLLLCFSGGSMILSGQAVDIPVVQEMPQADTIEVIDPVIRQIKGAPVPGIHNASDISLDKDASLSFIQKISSSSAMWKKQNDPLREALKNLEWMVSEQPEDSLLRYLSDYSFDKIRVPVEDYYVFDSIRIILPVIRQDSVLKDSLPPVIPEEMFIEAGRKLEKVRLSPDAKPVIVNDTLMLNDSVYILMDDFFPAQLPHNSHDTIVLVITDTLPETSLYKSEFPFRSLKNPYITDSLEAAVTSLMTYLIERDSTEIRITSENGRGSNIWLNGQSDDLIRFWLPDSDGDSVTVWIGSPDRNTISLKTEEGILFKKQAWHDKYVDTRVNVTTAKEEALRRVALTKIKPDLWGFNTDFSYQLSQGALSNWAKGGKNNVSTVLDVTSALKYNNKASNVSSSTTVRVALGLQASGTDADIEKTLDILELNQKISHKAFGKFDLTGQLQFKTQALPGYDDDDVKVSKFFNPATLILGYGLEYKPDKKTSISFSPVSYKGTFVPDTANIDQTQYGIDEGKRSMNEFGAYLTINNKSVLFKKIQLTNKIQLFSNFLSKPQNIDIDWEMTATTSLNWFTNLKLYTYLIYDDNTRFTVYDENGDAVIGTDGEEKEVPKLQLKELLGVSFIVKF